MGSKVTKVQDVVKDDPELCVAWTRGQCYFEGTTDLCLKRHFYLEWDAESARPIPLPQMSSDSEFTSPLVVKRKTFVETHRRVEVDLETGNRRSWLETESKDLIDITGEDTPKNTVTSEQLEEENMQDRTNQAKEMKENRCSQCGREFKGRIGVRSHQRHPKSKCHVV